jgi:methyl-accepting chemotaxis protein
MRASRSPGTADASRRSARRVGPDTADIPAALLATALRVRRRLLLLALCAPALALLAGLLLRPSADAAVRVFDWLLIALAVSAAMAVLMALRLARAFEAQALEAVRRMTDTIERVSAGDADARSRLAGDDAFAVLARRLDGLLAERVGALERASRESEALGNSVVAILEAVGTMAARKDLTLKVPASDDITGAIADAINLLSAETRRVLASVRAVARGVAEATVAVKGQGDSAGKAAAREQREVEMAALELAAAAAALQAIAARAQAGSEAAGRAEQASAQAMAAVAQTVAGVGRTRELIRGTEKRVKRLGERSQEVGQAVGIVQGIAERTGIVALNASMHAASAGESARSFAVVADELQRLSVSAREATLEVGRLVNAIQAETHDTVIAMNHAIAQVVAISRLADDAAREMHQTREQTAALASDVRGISSTAAEQARTGATLQERAQIIQEASAETARQLAQQTIETQRLVGTARALLDEVRAFRLGDGEAS